MCEINPIVSEIGDRRINFSGPDMLATATLKYLF